MSIEPGDIVKVVSLTDHYPHWPTVAAVSDVDLAALGYVRLDEIEGEAIETPTEWISIPVGSVDVEALREAWSAILVNDYDSSHVAIVDDAIQFLAALDGEGEA